MLFGLSGPAKDKIFLPGRGRRGVRLAKSLLPFSAEITNLNQMIENQWSNLGL
jgi:hypothetical protein